MTHRIATPGSDPSAAYRLPYTVEPRRYELRLAPDLESSTFEGEVRIEATAHESVSEIVLNAAELTILSASVTDADGRELRAEATVDEDDERLTLSLGEAAGEGSLEIYLAFSGTLNDQLRGFYRSTFTDSDGVTRTIATTQFEATDARRAFPCFDEPDRKAVFSITLDTPEGLSAFSNSPIVEESALVGGRTRLRFADTISMSSYLVACVVGPLEATDPVEVDGIPVRVVHVSGKSELYGFALEVAAHALRFFTEWFGLPYPAEKLDLVAIPDFAFGAMENLGCVTFREVVLLVDPEHASRLELQRVADVIAHEIAHMWFGDLVTMRWWNGIWLNEAFATFMEVTCVDAFRPSWKRWTSFGLERSAAMATDALHSTRPVEYPVGRPEEAQGMFDVLTYEKGASVLRMLEQYLGSERFRDGVRRYLTEHRLSNTETSDLWDAIEAASGEPVREIMDSWILQGGFPAVVVGEQAPESGGGRVSLTQQPFFYAPGDADSAIGAQWHVPVVARTVAARPESELRLLLGKAPVSLDTDSPAAQPTGQQGPLWLVNARGDGYYRVRYPATHLERLARSLGFLDALERANLLGDTWAVVVARRSDLGDFLLLVEALEDEDDPDVWSQATSALSFLDHLVDDRSRPQLAAYTRAVVGPAFEHVGWERRRDEDDRTPTLRAQLLGIFGTVGQDRDVRARCSELMEDELSGNPRLDPDLAPAVVGVVASAGGEAEFEAFLDRFRHPQNPQEEVRYRHALTAFKDAKLAERVFELALTEVRSQDVPFLVQSLLSSRENGPATWERVRDHWDELVERIPVQSVARMLEGVRLLCRDRKLAREIEDFLAAHPLKTGQRTLDQTVERLAVNVALAERMSEVAGGALAAGLKRLAVDGPH